jgi:hypothetical protein
MIVTFLFMYTLTSSLCIADNDDNEFYIIEKSGGRPPSSRSEAH